MCKSMNVRITINLPDDLHARVAVDALRKPRNSKEAVITDILRAHYAGGTTAEVIERALGWRIDKKTVERIGELRREAKRGWK